MRLPFQPVWICGDSVDLTELAPGEYDLIFTCPPYGDLERYSDAPQDLSTMDYEHFKAAYSCILTQAVAMLKEHRFACIVVGEFRDKKGFQRGFVAETIRAMTSTGMHFYNEAILLNNSGSAAIRAKRIFEPSRKLVRCHQHVLVFVKGDPRLATAAIKGTK